MNSPAAPAAAHPSRPVRVPHVYLFATCLVDLFEPQAGLDAVRLLEREGVCVHYPRAQSCCGQPAYTSGNPDAARAVVAAQLDLFPEPWPIVVPSGSCAGMMRHHWPRLFADDAAQAERVQTLAGRVVELSDFLQRVLQVDWAGYCMARPAACHAVVLHTSCSARREMGTRAHGVALLDTLPGVERREQAREWECCGFGGTFSLKHPAISGAMVHDKLEAIRATGCTHVVSADCGCLLNLRHAAHKQGEPIQAEHLASFLWRHSQGAAALAEDA